MAPSERATQCIRAAEGGSLEAQTYLGVWHLSGEEGLDRDAVKGAVLLRNAGNLGYAPA